MAAYLSSDSRKVTTHRLIEMKQRGEKISMLTSYDYTTAQIVDGAGVDVILVGDSASNVIAGNITTLPISLDQMIFFTESITSSPPSSFKASAWVIFMIWMALVTAS